MKSVHLTVVSMRLLQSMQGMMSVDTFGQTKRTELGIGLVSNVPRLITIRTGDQTIQHPIQTGALVHAM